MPRVEAPEGWVKKVERAREGKVWVGYFHVWEATKDGRSVRRKKEKTLGAATKPKHEVIQQLAEYIAEHSGKLAKQGKSISTFAELWTEFTFAGAYAAQMLWGQEAALESANRAAQAIDRA